MRGLCSAILLLALACDGAAAEPKPLLLGAAVSAVVARVFVADGAHVEAGQKILEFDCRPLEAQSKVAAADLVAAEAVNARAMNGPRPEDVAIGVANLNVAQARAEEAADAYARARALTEGVTITRAQVLEIRRDARISGAQLNDAQKRLDLLHAGSRQEDVDEARAHRDGAAAALTLAQARLAQCTVTTPVAGKVELLAAPGQFFSEYAPTPVAKLTPDAP